MPSVQVTYNPNNTPAWSFSPDPVRVTASGNIVFTQAPGSNWKFTGASVQSGGSQFGTPQVNGNGSEMTLNDVCSAKGQWCYTVSVLPTGATQSVTSPDPQIVNDPPSPVPTPPASK
jgi:hypothetical protein